MTSNKIMEVYSDKEAIIFKAQCGCCFPDCYHILTLKKDDDEIVLIIDYEHKKLSIWERIKLLFTGIYENQNGFIFESSEQLKDYMKAMNEASWKLYEEIT